MYSHLSNVKNNVNNIVKNNVKNQEHWIGSLQGLETWEELDDLVNNPDAEEGGNHAA